MIVSRIAGGLGNQLFQYAAGRALALHHGTPLALDTRHYGHDRSRRFLLDAFRIEVAKEADLPPLWPQAPLRHILWRALGTGPRLVREGQPAFQPGLAELGPNLYLDGYWQSERYFAAIADTLRAELTPRAPLSDGARALLDQIAAVPAVSLHIRRGDYVLDPNTKQPLGTCSLDYYARAAALVAERTATDPVIFAFSDEPDWVRDNLRLPFETRVIEHQGADDPVEDLWLMKSCRHHVIANSSFSWWGGWLNPSPDKMVIAPAKWFPQPGKSNPDILPPGWMAIDGGV